MARQIKRYPNRKFYDTESKSYTTLDDLTGIIHSGETITVTDHESGADISSQVLTQIIYEEGRKGHVSIPDSVLHDIVRWGNRAVDKGVEQIVGGVDKMVQNSISKWLPIGNKAEIEQLEAKVRELENLVEQLITDLEQKQ